ncbi:hypothetical protein MW290_06370 [Aquincola tertiaricarbonis]|uniref:Uncharacterized protein n=1 Tax=Aquincola tertiaricarbonis TaxID=391953 RepID=A0ABY4SAY2_AQUTE|nr:hypothetical protein [Aquincola tertiaricarbonis]URI08196.1 hypothetical protein MW290_06370 [Aquincola tertiaricarbonis]
MNQPRLFSQVAALALSAVFTLGMLAGVNGLAHSEHAANDAQLLVQQQAASAPRG